MTSGQQQWMKFANETYIKEAGWYFKTLAVQEIGKGTFVNDVNVISLFSDSINFYEIIFTTGLLICSV